jgi:hypothetical protein
MRLLVGLVLVAALGLCGCNSNNSYLMPNSRFVYPNSNVETLGPVSGSKTDLCGLFMVPIPRDSGARTVELVDEITKQQGGDLVINGYVTHTMGTIPYLFSWCTTSVSGTAARSVVGNQALD